MSGEPADGPSCTGLRGWTLGAVVPLPEAASEAHTTGLDLSSHFFDPSPPSIRSIDRPDRHSSIETNLFHAWIDGPSIDQRVCVVL